MAPEGGQPCEITIAVSPSNAFVSYDERVDIWSAGVIMAELLNGVPLFMGETDIDQIYRVMAVLGAPDPCTWPEIRDLPDFSKLSFPAIAQVPLKSVVPEVSPLALDLLSKLMALSPGQRISATQARPRPLAFLYERLPDFTICSPSLSLSRLWPILTSSPSPLQPPPPASPLLRPRIGGVS